MMEAFKSAKELSEREKNQYIQLLSVFNLRKIDSQPALKDKEKKSFMTNSKYNNIYNYMLWFITIIISKRSKYGSRRIDW